MVNVLFPMANFVGTTVFLQHAQLSNSRMPITSSPSALLLLTVIF